MVSDRGFLTELLEERDSACISLVSRAMHDHRYAVASGFQVPPLMQMMPLLRSFSDHPDRAYWLGACPTYRLNATLNALVEP